MTKLVLNKKIQESQNVYTLYFTPQKSIKFLSGAYTHIFIPSLLLELHKPVREMTIASSPDEADIIFSINTKSKSNFQQKIINLKIGDSVQIFGTKNHIKLPINPSKIVMIAQGVGITPFRSMIFNSIQNNLGHSFTLIHIDRNSYLYQEEFSELDFEQFRITRENIDNTIKQVNKGSCKKVFYIAGGSEFVQEINRKLLNLEVNQTNIHLDKFKGLNS